MRTVYARGADMPVLGFGTYRMTEDEVRVIVPKALDLGYRHIDTAQIYENEAAVGEAIERSGVPRDEIFLTTKVWVDRFAHERLLESVAESLDKLRCDRVDLLLLHWPKSPVPLADRIASMNEVVRRGQTRFIGVSNFNTTMFAETVRLSEAPIVTNQIEYHPYIDQTKVIGAARAAGAAITAYYPMADGKIPGEPLLQEIGARHGKTAAQVALRWLLQQEDVCVLSKTATEARLAENFDIFDFELSAAEMSRIHALSRAHLRLCSYESVAEVWDD